MSIVSNPTPNNTPEANKTHESPDWRERLELLLGFLRFYFRQIAGLILVCAVATLIYKLGIQSQDNKIANKSRETKSSPEPQPKNAKPSLDSAGLADKDTGAVSQENGTAPTRGSRVDSEFANQSINQLIERSIKIHQTWGREATGIGIALCRERSRISQHLLTRSLTESQRIFAITSYIDAISLVDSLNVSSKMNLPDTRDSLVEIDQRYCSHENLDVSAKANLAISLAPLYDFMVTEDPELATQFESECRLRLTKIAKNSSALTRLANLAIVAHNKIEIDSPSATTFAQLSELLFELPEKQSRRIALQYREHLLYDRFDSRKIALLGSEDDPVARQQVKDFFQTLTEHPDSTPQTYRKAVEIIKSFQRLGRTEDSIRLTQWLERITDQIPVDQNQQTIKKSIQEALNDPTRNP